MPHKGYFVLLALLVRSPVNHQEPASDDDIGRQSPQAASMQSDHVLP